MAYWTKFGLWQAREDRWMDVDGEIGAWLGSRHGSRLGYDYWSKGLGYGSGLAAWHVHCYPSQGEPVRVSTETNAFTAGYQDGKSLVSSPSF